MPVWEEQHNLMAYYRKGDKTLLVIGNYQKEAQSVTLPSPPSHILINNYPDIQKKDNTLSLYSYQVLVLEM